MQPTNGPAKRSTSQHQPLELSCFDLLLPCPVASQEAAAPAAATQARTALDEMGNKGEFARKESVYRQWIRKGSEFEPEGEGTQAVGQLGDGVRIPAALGCTAQAAAALPPWPAQYVTNRSHTVPIAAGRYHLYVSLACPWASRCVAALNMKASGSP